MVGRRVFTRRRIREGRACRDRILRSDGALAVVRRGIIRYAPGDGTLSVITDTDADFGLRVSYNLCYTFSARRIVNFLRGERRETSVSPGCRPAAGERGLFRVPATGL